MKEKLQKNALFQRLKSLEVETFGEKNYPISNNIENHLLEVANSLLNQIPSFMPEYTLHDVQHCLNILDIIDYLLPDDVNLNIVELQILIYAVFLHDIGMVINRDNAEALKKDEEFDHITMEFGEEVDDDEILTEYIRRTHVARSLSYVDKFKNQFDTYKIDFTFNEIDISAYIKSVIESHELPIQSLKNAEKYPTRDLVSNLRVNVQFLSVLLRLGDIMDFDISRTPYFLFKHIGLKNNISLAEWNKHLSVTGREITSNSIEYQATCHDISTHRRVEQFIGWIEQERKETIQLLDEQNIATYTLNIRSEVKYRITSKGYKYNNLELHLDYEKILHILMGTNLYDSVDVFLRELLQNSYDACKYRQELLTIENEPYYPLISITYDTKNKIFTIHDNGIGINADVFSNYVISIGRSYYKSKYFTRNKMDFIPISNFGIGIISCFMVSDFIEIKSKREDDDAIHYHLNLKDKYIEEKECEIKKIGTTIKLKFHNEYAEKLLATSIEKIIAETMSYQPIPIKVKINDEPEIILDSKRIALPEGHLMAHVSSIIEFTPNDMLEGYMVLASNGEDNLFQNTKIAQQYFVISENGNNINLSPTWIRNIRFNINIPDRYKIRLKASRNKIELDDKNFLLIKEFVLQKIIGLFKQIEITHGKENVVQYFSIYAGDGRGRQSPYIDFELDFLLKLPLFLFGAIDSSGMAMNRCSLHEIIANFQQKEIFRLAVIRQDYLTCAGVYEYLLAQQYDYVIFSDSFNFHYFYQLIEPCLVSNTLVPSHVSGFTYNSLQAQYIEELTPSMYQQSYSWTSVDENIGKYFCLISNNHINGFNIIVFNKNHPISHLFYENENLIAIRSFKTSFINNFAQILFYDQTLLDTFVWNIQERHFFSHIKNSEIYALKFQKCLSNTFLKTLNETLKEKVLKQLVDLGKIDVEALDEYQLQKDDFPSWYFCE